MTPLRVFIDARLGAGRFGGVEQVVIGLAAALSRLADGDEEYLFLTHREQDDWIRQYVFGPCRLLHSRRSYLNRRSRAVARAVIERVPGIGVRFAVRPSDGTVERAGVELIHFPFQDAFTTEVPPLSLSGPLHHRGPAASTSRTTSSTSTCPSCSAAGSVPGARRSTAPTATAR